MRTTLAIRLLPLLAMFATLAGCESYALRGRVVEGDVSYAQIVDQDDPRLLGPGIGGAQLHLQLDPGRLNRETLDRTASDPSGDFALTTDEIGAGLFEYNVGLFVRRRGYEPVEDYFVLPPARKRLLVVLAPGEDRETNENLEDFDALIEQYR